MSLSGWVCVKVHPYPAFLTPLQPSYHTHSPYLFPCLQPLLSLGALSLSGWVVRARQLTLAPLTTAKPFPVGRFHAADIEQNVKGCR